MTRFEVVKKIQFYSVSERQLVTEMDSPAPGLTSDIAVKTAEYEFFANTNAAESYIEELKERYQKENPTLKEEGQYRILRGSLNHRYDHVFEIQLFVERHERPFRAKIPKTLEALLEKPKKRILEDRRTPTSLPGLPQEDLSGLKLF